MVERKTLSKIALVCVILLLFIFCGGQIALAEKPLVIDQAELYSDSEESQLSQRAQGIGTAYQMDIVIVTTANAEGKTARDYADDFFDYNGYGVGDDRDGILFLIDMDNREVYISTSGMSIRYLTDLRIERILDKVFAGGLTDGLMYEATMAFLEATEYYLQAGIPADQYTVYETEVLAKGLTPVEILIGAGIAVIVGAGFYFLTQNRYKGKPKPVAYRYRDKNELDFRIDTEKLINSSVTYRIIEDTTSRSSSSSGSSSGRSTVHRSSSGRTHGGGGRKF
ncbi:MAG: TPM domain-containing protein [Peptococcia bacterium]